MRTQLYHCKDTLPCQISFLKVPLVIITPKDLTTKSYFQLIWFVILFRTEKKLDFAAVREQKDLMHTDTGMLYSTRTCLKNCSYCYGQG